MTVHILTENAPGFSFHYRELAKKTVSCVLAVEHFPYEAQISLFLADEAQICKLNRETRGIDAVTDVLSFPMLTYPAPADYRFLESERRRLEDPQTGEILLGDIALCVGRVRAQALEYGHSEKREYAFLIAHSMLHLLGYDHMESADAARMQERQRIVMEALNISR